MDRYKETFETWNKIASLYQDKFMNLDLYNNTYDIICDSITVQNAKILEVGCGPGNISKYMLNKRPDFDILGIDIASNMIELAKINNPTAHFVQMDSRRLDEINNKFDGIVCGFVLPYISQIDSIKFIGDCYSLLTEGGLLYISFVEGDPEKSGFKMGSTGYKSFFYYYNLNELIQQLLNFKFQQPEIYKVKFKRTESEFETHTILTVKKQ
jgi:ubiquinone/menaquinone biosynthesis C-methylase UbiE